MVSCHKTDLKNTFYLVRISSLERFPSFLKHEPMEITKTGESQINYETHKYSGLHPRICAFIFSFISLYVF